jgi:hypothetical protein
MIRTKFGLEYLYCPPIERLGLVIFALVLKQARLSSDLANPLSRSRN